jgi:hypothetical protein
MALHIAVVACYRRRRAVVTDMLPHTGQQLGGAGWRARKHAEQNSFKHVREQWTPARQKAGRLE